MVQMISWQQVNSVKPIGDQDLGSQNLSTGPKQARTKNLNTFASQQFATDRKRRKRCSVLRLMPPFSWGVAILS